MLKNSANERILKLSKRLLEVCTAEVLCRIEPQESKVEALEQLLKNEIPIKSLFAARAAVAVAEHNQHVLNISTIASVANNVYDVVCNLSVDDTRRVFCETTIEPMLFFEISKAVKKARGNFELHENLKTLKKFIEDASITTWCYEDHLIDDGTKTFKQVSKEQFEEKVSAEFTEITGINLGGIRMAYKKLCVLSSVNEEIATAKESFETHLKVAMRATDISRWKKGISILYPDKICHGEYILYVPKRLKHK